MKKRSLYPSFRIALLLVAFIIARYSAEGQIISTIAGSGASGFSGDGGPATAAQFNTAMKIQVAPSGKIYIADVLNQRIRMISTSGVISTFAGTGSAGYGGDGGPATAAQFDWPSDIAIDNTGNVFIADRNNNRIRKIDTSGTITTVAGNGTHGYSGDSGPATAANIAGPQGVAVDNSGNIYIADADNYMIRVVDVSGTINLFAGSGYAGYGGDGGSAVTASFLTPRSVAVDASGNVYIGDEDDNRVRKVNTSGIISTIAGNGTGGYSGDGGAATAAELHYPLGVTTDAAGNVFIADGSNSVIRKVSATGVITTIAGTGTAGFSGDGGPATAAALNTPFGIAVDGAGNIYIPDTYNNRMRKITGCTAAAGSIIGSSAVCAGSTITLSDTSAGGTWSSSAASVATVSSTGVVTGITSGTATISYSVTGTCGTSIATKNITVENTPVAGYITGATTFCSFARTTLVDSAGSAGGIWTISDTTVATVSSTGVVIGVPLHAVHATGTAMISYSVTNSCGTSVATDTITTVMVLYAGYITGPKTVCTEAFIGIRDSLGDDDGIWQTYDSSIATVTTTGIRAANVTGINPGRVLIAYSKTNECGTARWIDTFTVNTTTSSMSISGASPVCAGSSITLSSTGTGGTWISSDTSIATVDTTGVVTGIAAGVDMISYTRPSSCGTAFTRATITVNSFPTAGSISGATSTCAGTTTTLSSTITGGFWSSSDVTVAIVSSTGIVTGIAAGSATITYTVTNSCGSDIALTTITVNPMPTIGAISGASIICVGSSTTLSSSDTGGVWTSGTATVATVSATGVVTGLTNGTSVISYTIASTCGPLASTHTISVNGTPSIGISLALCTGGDTYTLYEDVSGGTWSSADTTIATITSAGLVTSASTNGTTTISYTMPCGSYISGPVFVTGAPTAISGPSTVCVGDSIALTDSIIPPTYAFTWSSSATSIASVDPLTLYPGAQIMGISAGTVTITYSTGCGPDALKTITVTPAAGAGTISGPTSVCIGSTVTLTDTATGGIWFSAGASIATIDSATGIVTGVSAGSTTISYIVTSACGSTVTTSSITVNPLPTAGTISGSTNVCAGTSTTLSSSISGGTWSSTTTSVATAGSGVITGVSAGTTTISYSVSSVCGTASTTTTVTVLPLPTVAPITGGTAICPTSTTTLSDTSSGGTWSSSTTSVATVTSVGIVTGVGAGSTTISYTITNSCGSISATYTATVNPLPHAGAITGGAPICESHITTFADTTTGGTWSIGSTSIATVTSGGVVRGISGGTTSLFYTVTNSCGADTAVAAVTIYALPVITLTTTHGCNDNDIVIASGVTGGTYSWSGPGMTCGVCDTNIVTIFGTTTYTVTVVDSHACTDTNTITINANRIKGHITFSGTAPDTLDCKVWLIQYNPADSSLTALDSVYTCMDGSTPFYEFSGRAAGNYMVKAKLVYGTIPGTSGYVPTYSSSTTYWYSAAVAAHTTGTDSLPINMVYGTVPTGSGFISGYVYSGAGKGTSGDVPVNGMIVYLRNATTNILTYVYTNSLGYYSFSNLADGTYNIYPAEFSYYTIPSAAIVLSPGAGTKLNVNFKQHTGSGTITPYDNLLAPDVKVEQGIQLYPNPTTGNVFITIPNQGSEAYISVTDITGKTLLTTTTENTTTEINMNNVSAGIYLVTVKTDKAVFTSKLIAQ